MENLKELLPLYERLQKVLREKMGPEQVGDRIYDPDFEQSGFISAIDRDRIDYITDEGVTDEGDCYWTTRNDFLRLPLPIDPVNPERGLHGMIDWTNKEMIIKGNWCEIKHRFIRIADGTPTEALLRALCEQEGV